MKKGKKRARPAARGIACPECGAPTGTLYTRPGGAVTTRRRVCPACGGRFTTAEKIVNRGPPGSTDRTRDAISIAQLLESLGLTPADLPAPVRLKTGGPTDARSDPDQER